MSCPVTRREPGVYAFINDNLPPEQVRATAVSLLNSKEIVRVVLGLTPDDQERFVHRIDQALSTLNAESAKPVASLGTICSTTRCLPLSAIISAGLEKLGSVPMTSMGPGVTWLGKHGHRPVSIKAFHFRGYPTQPLEEAKEILWERVPTWRRFSHPNVLPFLGVDMTIFQLALVYGSGEHDNILQYTASHPGAPRMALLLQVAKGLQYIHSFDVPHGDLRGGSIHIDGSGNACLAEYGLGPIQRNPKLTVAATPGAIEGLLAPELTHVESSLVTESKAADIFAFAMLALELFTTKPPFGGQLPARTALLISRGNRPEFPQNAEDVGLTPQMQNFLRGCWHHNPIERPTIDEVVRTLELLDSNEDPQIMIHKSPNVRRSTEDAQVYPKKSRTKPRKWSCGLF